MKLQLKEKLEIFKLKGWTYDPTTGDMFSHTGRLITGKHNGYIGCNVGMNNKIISVEAHQLAWYLHHNEVPLVIDHINRKRTDNRISNLRNIDKQRNAFNTNSRGYSKHGVDSFVSYIMLKGKQIYLGIFKKEELARQAYLDAKKIYHVV